MSRVAAVGLLLHACLKFVPLAADWKLDVDCDWRNSAIVKEGAVARWISSGGDGDDGRVGGLSGWPREDTGLRLYEGGDMLGGGGR